MNYIIGAFKPPCDIFVTFSDEKTRKQVSIKKGNGKTAMVPAFQSLETIAGEVLIAPVPGNQLSTGFKIIGWNHITTTPPPYQEVVTNFSFVCIRESIHFNRS